MKIRRALASATCVVVAMGMGSFVGRAAAAAPPANDTIGGAKNVAALPFTQTLRTTSATTDADDAQVNESCGAPLTNNSVWYTFTAGPSDTVLGVDTTGSDFSSGVIIATGSAGDLTTEACGPVSSELALTAGTKYYILVFDDTGSGGTLQLSIHGPGPKPANDKITHATTVGALPFSDSVDTTGATTDRTDAQANESCQAPATGNSVWYKFTAGADDSNIFVDSSLSSFAAGVLVATGTPGALTTVTCGPISVEAATTPGTTYYVMAFDFFGGGGGALQLDIGDAPTMNLNTYRDTRVDSNGVVHLRGTYSCSRASDVEIFASLVEIQGRAVVTGSFDTVLAHPRCDGSVRPWAGTVIPDSAGFGPGRAAAGISGLACGDIACTESDTTQVVKLSRGIKAPPTVATVTSRRTKVTRRAPGRAYGVRVPARLLAWGR